MFIVEAFKYDVVACLYVIVESGIILINRMAFSYLVHLPLFSVGEETPNINHPPSLDESTIDHCR